MGGHIAAIPKSLTCGTIRNDQNVVRAGRDFGLQLMARMPHPTNEFAMNLTSDFSNIHE
jgi:hypothetical protein